MVANKYYYAVGRRKTSTATCHLKKGKWNILVKKGENYIKIEDYFTWEGSADLLKDALFPLTVLWTSTRKMFDVTLHVNGGGLRGHAESIRLALSRALVEFNSDYRSILKPYGLLKRDPREKERKKPGLKGARRSPQWSKR